MLKKKKRLVNPEWLIIFQKWKKTDDKEDG